jgi:hypothetical protein
MTDGGIHVALEVVEDEDDMRGSRAPDSGEEKGTSLQAKYARYVCQSIRWHALIEMPR